VQPPLLSAAIAHNPNLRGFRAAVAGSGQHGAPMAVAAPLVVLAQGGTAAAAAAAAPDPGRAAVIACPRYLPGNAGSCDAATDPRGAGLAVGAADR
jgi:gamma-glutamyltranspeptidase/glutathione hydrolase